MNMPTISQLLQYILSKRYGEEVRGAIHDAIEKCYQDVNSATLREDAFQAALQAAIDHGDIPGMVIADNSISGAKIQDGTIPLRKLSEPVQITVDSALSASSTNPVQNKVIKGAIDELNGSLENLETGLTDSQKSALLACFRNVAWINNGGANYYNALSLALNVSNRRSELPDTFNQVEYLKSTGTQYIVLNDILSQIPIYVKSRLSFQVEGKTFLSAYKNGDSTSRFYLISFVNNYIACRIGNNTWAEISKPTVLPEIDKIYEIETDISYGSGGSIIASCKYEDGKKSEVYNSATVSGVSGQPLNLFVLAADGTKSSVTLYDIIIKSGNSIIFDGIPCVRKSDGKTGLYNAINDTFYANAVSTEFATGNIIE